MSALYSFPHHSPCPGFLLPFLPVCWAFSWTNHHKPNEISWPPSLMERVLFPPTHTYSSICVSSAILQLSGSQPLSRDLHSSSLWFDLSFKLHTAVSTSFLILLLIFSSRSFEKKLSCMDLLHSKRWPPPNKNKSTLSPHLHKPSPRSLQTSWFYRFL